MSDDRDQKKGLEPFEEELNAAEGLEREFQEVRKSR